MADAKFVANGRPLGGRSGILLRLVGESESFRGPAPVFILLGITMAMVRYLKSCFMAPYKLPAPPVDRCMRKIVGFFMTHPTRGGYPPGGTS